MRHDNIDKPGNFDIRKKMSLALYHLMLPIELFNAQAAAYSTSPEHMISPSSTERKRNLSKSNTPSKWHATTKQSTCGLLA